MKIQEPRKRLDYIDSAKAVSILMIMLGHITNLSNPLDTWMSSCKICIFYVISGYLLAYTNGLQKRTPAQFTHNILKTIAWPYLTFSILAIFTKCFFGATQGKDILHIFKDNLGKSLFLKGINSMWFLPTLFFGELIILLLYISPKIFRYIYALIGLLGLKISVFIDSGIAGSGLSGLWREHLVYLSDMAGKSIVAAWFVGFGIILYKLMKRYDLIEGHFTLKLCAGLLFTVSNIWLSQKNMGVDFNMMTMGEKPWLFIYGGVFGSLGLILLLDVISSRVSLEGLNYWGKNSLILMCVHTAMGFKAMAYAGWERVAYIPEEPGLEYIFACIMVLLILMLMMYGVIEIINKHFLFLVKYPKERRGR